MVRTVLVTGSSGFIGQAFCSSLAQQTASDTRVVCVSRKPTAQLMVDDEPAVVVVYVEANFADGPQLAEQLAAHGVAQVDVCVHLAAITGAGAEADCLETNVLGTHTLLRHCIDHLGCTKFVIASSIAASGCLSPSFVPQALPIPDEHPCLDTKGYGMSKYFVEELSRFLCLQGSPADGSTLDIINLRIAGVLRDDFEDELLIARLAAPTSRPSVAAASPMFLSDMLRCLHTCVDAPHTAGVRVFNAVDTTSCLAPGVTVPELVAGWWGEEVAQKLDLSHYEQPGHEQDALFDTRCIARELGFVPVFSARKAAVAALERSTTAAGDEASAKL